MKNRLYHVVVIWRDGDVEDADEFRLFAPTATTAKARGARRWKEKNSQWKHCKIVGVVVTP